MAKGLPRIPGKTSSSKSRSPPGASQGLRLLHPETREHGCGDPWKAGLSPHDHSLLPKRVHFPWSLTRAPGPADQ